jgi:hypothetical protein
MNLAGCTCKAGCYVCWAEAQAPEGTTTVYYKPGDVGAIRTLAETKKHGFDVQAIRDRVDQEVWGAKTALKQAKSRLGIAGENPFMACVLSVGI